MVPVSTPPEPHALSASAAAPRRAQPQHGRTRAPTAPRPRPRHELIAEAFGGKGYHVSTAAELRAALTEAIGSGGPSLIDCELDPTAGMESGHLANRNPASAASPAAVSAGA
nr:thiamine pyrophosphate-dependent enzyme [Mycobacterium avium]